MVYNTISFFCSFLSTYVILDNDFSFQKYTYLLMLLFFYMINGWFVVVDS